MHKPNILIIANHAITCKKLAQSLQAEGYAVNVCDITDVRQHLQTRCPDLVILPTINADEWKSLELARNIRQNYAGTGIILITSKSSEALAISALRAGVNDYFKQPFSIQEVVTSVKHILAQRRNGFRDQSQDLTVADNGQSLGFIGECSQIQNIKASLAKISQSSSTVLITGETGTGKGLVAELIHQHNERHEQPFVCVNAAALPDNLLESELFGYEKGAFTGASTRQPGKFELAQGGTLLLDEISEMSLHAQAKILHVLESNEIYRVGGRSPVELDVRILSATNQDPEQLVAERKFRKDLFYRLNVGRIHLPPLRERPEDIPLLLDYYIHHYNRRFGRQVEGFNDEAQEFLLHYDWPGNVRELKNLVEACFISLPSQKTTQLELPELFIKKLKEIEHRSRDERRRLLTALFTTQWNVSKAAQKLHWSRMTVYRKMDKYQIVRPQS